MWIFHISLFYSSPRYPYHPNQTFMSCITWSKVVPVSIIDFSVVTKKNSLFLLFVFHRICFWGRWHKIEINNFKTGGIFFMASVQFHHERYYQRGKNSLKKQRKTKEWLHNYNVYWYTTNTHFYRESWVMNLHEAQWEINVKRKPNLSLNYFSSSCWTIKVQ